MSTQYDHENDKDLPAKALAGLGGAHNYTYTVTVAAAPEHCRGQVSCKVSVNAKGTLEDMEVSLFEEATERLGRVPPRRYYNHHGSIEVVSDYVLRAFGAAGYSMVDIQAVTRRMW